jgi:hypothetical protein
LSEFIYYLNFNKFLGMPINRLSIIRAWWGISDLIGEDWTTWENEEELEKDVIYSWLGKHNTVFFRREQKLLHKDWNLREEKHITNWICWVKPTGEEWEIDEESDSDSIYKLTFDEFYQKLLKTPSSIDPCIEIKNQDSIPIFQYWQKYFDYDNTKKKSSIFSLVFPPKTYKLNTSCI